MDCKEWACNNIYTRWDGKWNCPNAADEAICSANPCYPDGHLCMSPHSNNFTCLSLARINDGHIDCIGGYDEQYRCGIKLGSNLDKNCRCFNETNCIHIYRMCDLNIDHCSSSYDRDLRCIKNSNSSALTNNITLRQRPRNANEKSYWIHLSSSLRREPYVYFTLKNHFVYSSVESITNHNKSSAITTVHNFYPNHKAKKFCCEYINSLISQICNRGVPVYQNNLNETSCLCPPAYFRHRCQYQSERVGVTLQFGVIQCRTVFTFVIMPIDGNTTIHSSEQVDYLSVRDCRKKFDVYLLYSSRPKHINQTFYLRIDIYDKDKMEYYFSMFYLILYSFLPVHRLSLQINVSMLDVTAKLTICPLKCLHGRCQRFLNVDQYFCQCSDGYSEALCTVKNACSCSSDSICVGVVNNRSICICPLDKFGPRCYLKRTICLFNNCSHDGQCIALDVKYSETEYFCLCSQSYMGLRCDDSLRKIEFHFATTIAIPQSILIHFIYVPSKPNSNSSLPPPDPIRSTLISKWLLFKWSVE
ncbi:unnamed protein product [Rotaria sp. Silwood2]|nr:unnamed protein product [Rotaria sp. Silwood2]